MMRLKKKLTIVFAVPVLFLALFLSGISIPLDFLDSSLESLCSKLLEREVTINGPVRLKTSLQPSLQFDGLTIGNPNEWSDDSKHFLSVKHAQAQISLPDLIRGDIRLLDIELTGVDLQLVTRTDHSSNYHFASPKPQANTQQTAAAHELTALDHISLRDISLNYVDEFSGKNYTFIIDEAHGQGMEDSPLEFVLKGTLSGQECSLKITGGTLRDLVRGNKSWPLKDGRLSLGNISLDTSGSLKRTAQEKGGYLALSFKGHSLEAIGEILNIPLPEVRDFSIDTNVALRPGLVQLSAIHLEALGSSLSGDIGLVFHGDHPSLQGKLSSDMLHSSLFAAFQEMDSAKEDTIKKEETAPQLLPWKSLEIMDIDLHLEISGIQAGDIDVRNIKSTISLVDGDLTVPLSFALNEIPIDAQLDILTSEAIPSILLQIHSEGRSLDPLLESLTKKKELSGVLGGFSLRGSSKGSTFQELMKGLSLDLTLEKSSLQNNSMIIVRSDALSLQRSPGKAYTLAVSGELLGSPLKLKTVLGIPLGSAVTTPPVLQLELTACDTELLLDSLLQSDVQKENTFSFSAKGEKLCGFLGPIEKFMGKRSGFSIVSNGAFHKSGGKLNFENITVGDTTLDATAELIVSDNHPPHISATVHSKKIDLAAAMLQKTHDSDSVSSKKSAAPENEETLQEKLLLLNTILSKEIFSNKQLFATNANIDVDIEQLATGRGIVSDINLSVIVEDGKLKRSPFHARVGVNVFSGSAAVNAAESTPAVHMELTADDFDLPAMLQELGMNNSPEITARHLGIELTFPGKNLKEMLLNTSQKVHIQDGEWLLSREMGQDLDITFKDVHYSINLGEPATISLQGDINSTPLAVEIRGKGLFAKGSNKPVTLSVQGNLGDNTLSVNGRINRRQNAGNTFKLSTDLHGNNLNTLSEFLGYNLPPFGPYRLAGSMEKNDSHTIRLHDMAVQVGDSTLQGNMLVEGTAVDGKEFGFPLNIHTTLSAETIQLNDFQLGDWSPVAVQKTEPAVDDKTGEEQKETSSKIQDLFSEELGEKVHAFLDVNMEKVLSGTDMLGSGQLKSRLEEGKYSLDTLQLNLPGGSIHMQASLFPTSQSISANLSMTMDHFDYGILARRTVPDSNLKGELNLRLNLHSIANSPLQLKEHMNGYFRFGVKPEEFEAGILDLWAVNIITAALPALMKGSSSEVNCLAGDFQLDDSIMTPDVFLLDTSNMRVQGKGEVDFKSGEIDFHMNPTPKAAHFFSLATPITVSGTIFDPDIGVSASGVAGTIFRQAASVITVPFQWIFTDNLEANGNEVCGAAMQWSKKNADEKPVQPGFSEKD